MEAWGDGGSAEGEGGRTWPSLRMGGWLGQEEIESWDGGWNP